MNVVRLNSFTFLAHKPFSGRVCCAILCQEIQPVTCSLVPVSSVLVISSLRAVSVFWLGFCSILWWWPWWWSGFLLLIWNILLNSVSIFWELILLQPFLNIYLLSSWLCHIKTKFSYFGLSFLGTRNVFRHFIFIISSNFSPQLAEVAIISPFYLRKPRLEVK